MKYFKGKNSVWNELMENINNPQWRDERDLSRHLSNIHAAVLTVGRWFDAEDLHGTLKTFHAVEANNPGIFKGSCSARGPTVAGIAAMGNRLGRCSFTQKPLSFSGSKLNCRSFGLS